MNSLKNFTAVQNALANIAQRHSIEHDNGTYGKTLKCYFWDKEEFQSKEYRELLKKITIKKFSGEDYSEDMATLETIPAGKTVLIFKLVDPMMVRGTKVYKVGEKTKNLDIPACEYIYIQSDLLQSGMDLLKYEETGEMEVDRSGNETEVINIHLNKCMLDVKEGKRNYDGSWFRKHRVYITDLSFRTMQVVGSLMNKQKYANRKAWDIMEDDELEAA